MHLDEAVSASVLAFQKTNVVGEVFNIASGTTVTVNLDAKFAIQATGIEDMPISSRIFFLLSLSKIERNEK